MTRTFEAKPAVRTSVPSLVSLFGPSGSGKTYSALRLAKGMQEIVGGEIYGIDTEAKRMLHYADEFDFKHLPFIAPFSPLDYLAAIEYCVEQGAKTIIVDSMSHEHEGPGGVLEWHDAEMDGDFKKSMLAWAKPKAARRRLLNTVIQLGCNLLLCFRAKEKLELVTGKEPKKRGWMPIGGEEFVYDMTLSALLYPVSGGIPTWKPTLPGERQMVKLPNYLEPIFVENKPLDESIGRSLAEWAGGQGLSLPESGGEMSEEEKAVAEMTAEIEAADQAALDDIVDRLKREAWSKPQLELLRAAFKKRKAELDG